MKTAGKGSHGRRSTRRTCLASGGCINAKDRHRCSDFFYLRSSRGVSQGRHRSPESSSSLWTTCRPFHPLKLLLTTCCPCSLKKIFSNPTRGDVSKRTQSSMLERYLCNPGPVRPHSPEPRGGSNPLMRRWGSGQAECAVFIKQILFLI